MSAVTRLKQILDHVSTVPLPVGFSHDEVVGGHGLSLRSGADGVIMTLDGEPETTKFQVLGVHSGDRVKSVNTVFTTERMDKAARHALGLKPQADPRSEAAAVIRDANPPSVKLDAFGFPILAPAGFPPALPSAPAQIPTHPPAQIPALPGPPAVFPGPPASAPPSFGSIKTAIVMGANLVDATLLDKVGTVTLKPTGVKAFIRLFPVTKETVEPIYGLAWHAASTTELRAAVVLAVSAMKANLETWTSDDMENAISSVQNKDRATYDYHAVLGLFANATAEYFGKPARVYVAL